MERPFALFEDIPMPAILLDARGVRGNHAARAIFGNHIQDAAGSLGVVARPKQMKLETMRGSRQFKIFLAHADEGPVAWLELEALDENWEMEELKKQDSFKTQFLNMAAHELNTPLTPIRLQHHLLTNEILGPLSAEQQKSHAVISRNLDRLSSLISDILDVARLESAALKVNLEPMDFCQVVEDSLASYASTAQEVGVNLTFSLPETATVMGSSGRISQVVDNLISNAIKFTPDGGKVHVQLSKSKDGVMLSVEDTGPGLTADQMSRLFQPFSQVHTNDVHGGTGLGLYICKGILEAHGKTIQCESAGAGQGARFWFELPASIEPVKINAPAPKTKNALADRLRELI